MLILLSPAKTQATHCAVKVKTSKPAFQKQAVEIISLLKKYAKKDLIQLMKVSDSIASSVYQNIANFTKNTEMPAIFTYQGEVYKTLHAEDFTEKDLEFAQSHLAILSGLHGLLKPLDGIHNYRLEMKTPLIINHVKLVEYWKALITKKINEWNPSIIVNLASEEYTQAIDWDSIKSKVIHIQFKDFKNGSYKIVGIYAKKARGMMARYLIQHKAKSISAIKTFKKEGYYFSPKLSTNEVMVFLRD
jgi:cytoplasmic iron level regulating protein YaaA (DUF328/UPF0246 family)